MLAGAKSGEQGFGFDGAGFRAHSRSGFHVAGGRHFAQKIVLRCHIQHDVRGGEVVRRAGGFAGAFDAAIGDDALDPAVGIDEEIELRGGGRGFAARISGRDLGMSLGDGVASAEFGVEFDGNFIGGDFAAALAHVGWSIEHDQAIVAADFHATASGGDGEPTTFFRGCQIELNVVREADDFLLGTVGHAVGVAGALRETELHRGGGGGVAAFAIEREIACGDLQIFVCGLAGSGRSAGEINLDVALADDIATGGLVITFASVNVVVAAAVVAIDGDPDVLKKGAILVLILGGVGCADGEELAALVAADVREFSRFLLHGCGDGRRRVLASAGGLDGAAGVNTGDDERD